MYLGLIGNKYLSKLRQMGTYTVLLVSQLGQVARRPDCVKQAQPMPTIQVTSRQARYCTKEGTVLLISKHGKADALRCPEVP